MRRYTPKLLSKERLCDAVDCMLTMQNSDGGFASYELVRGPKWLEAINPAEVFGRLLCFREIILGLILRRRGHHDRVHISGMHHLGDHCARPFQACVP